MHFLPTLEPERETAFTKRSTLQATKCKINGAWGHLSSKVFENSRAVHRRGGSYSAVARCSGLEVSVDTAYRELRG